MTGKGKSWKERKTKSAGSSPHLSSSLSANAKGKQRADTPRDVSRNEVFDQLAGRMYDSLEAVKDFRAGIITWSLSRKAVCEARIALIRRWQAAYEPAKRDLIGHLARLEGYEETVAQPILDGLLVMTVRTSRPHNVAHLTKTCHRIVASAKKCFLYATSSPGSTRIRSA